MIWVLHRTSFSLTRICGSRPNAKSIPGKTLVSLTLVPGGVSFVMNAGCFSLASALDRLYVSESAAESVSVSENVALDG